MKDSKIIIAFSPDSQTQLLQSVNLAEIRLPITARVLVEKFEWQKKYPQIYDYEVGVFSQKIDWDSNLKAGDRLEIYRPLTVTPMRKRQLIMAQRQKMLNHQRAKNNIAKKLVDKKAYYNALRATQKQEQ